MNKLDSSLSSSSSSSSSSSLSPSPIPDKLRRFIAIGEALLPLIENGDEDKVFPPSSLPLSSNDPIPNDDSSRSSVSIRGFLLGRIGDSFGEEEDNLIGSLTGSKEGEVTPGKSIGTTLKGEEGGIFAFLDEEGEGESKGEGEDLGDMGGDLSPVDLGDNFSRPPFPSTVFRFGLTTRFFSDFFNPFPPGDDDGGEGEGDDLLIFGVLGVSFTSLPRVDGEDSFFFFPFGEEEGEEMMVGVIEHLFVLEDGDDKLFLSSDSPERPRSHSPEQGSFL